jgi:hypothetical protein
MLCQINECIPVLKTNYKNNLYQYHKPILFRRGSKVTDFVLRNENKHNTDEQINI